MRKLATIQTIIDIKDIIGADNIQLATVLGWGVIVKKNEYKVGDVVVYVEIDSKLPELPEFEFLRPKKFIIKTYKLSKFNVVSQGIVFPMTILPKDPDSYDIGEDVTDIIGIKKHDPQADEEAQIEQDRKPKSFIFKALSRYKWFRDIIGQNKRKGGFPKWLSKTDETRLNAMPSILETHKDRIFYNTIKLDGQSGSFAIKYNTKVLFFKLPEFFVCSRNMRLTKPDTSNYWKIAKKFNIEEKLKNLNRNIAIQGEIVGPKIQKNKYELTELDFYVFSIFDIDSGKYVNRDELIITVQLLGLKMVPVLDYNFKLKNTVDEMVEYSNGDSIVYKTIREGVVFRAIDDSHISFKVISPDFLLKYKE